MTVPFEQIGPGQVGRLAYQVIGKDGPIFNPQNIAYLSPNGTAATPIYDANSALAGLAGLNLAASVGTLAISTMVLHEVHQMQRQLAGIDAKMDELRFTLSDIQRRVQRIDTRVSESHLREAFRHCLSRSINNNSIDLTRLTPLLDDIQNIEDTLEAGLLFNFGIRLSSDLRDDLQTLLSLLFGIRRSIVCLHNQAVAFFPERLIKYNRYGDYVLPGAFIDIVQFAIAAGRTDAVFNSFIEVLGDAVYTQFFFANDEQRQQFRQLAVEHYYNPQMSALHSMPTTSMGLKLSVVLDQLQLDYSDDDNAISTAADVFRLWIAKTDASLLFRLKAELAGIKDGYANAFYSELADEPTVELKPSIFALAAITEHNDTPAI